MDIYADVRAGSRGVALKMSKNSLTPEATAKLGQIMGANGSVTVYYRTKVRNAVVRSDDSFFKLSSSLSRSVKKELEAEQEDTLRIWMAPEVDEDGNHVLAIIKL